jgi:hypothetical protein
MGRKQPDFECRRHVRREKSRRRHRPQQTGLGWPFPRLPDGSARFWTAARRTGIKQPIPPDSNANDETTRRQCKSQVLRTNPQHPREILSVSGLIAARVANVRGGGMVKNMLIAQHSLKNLTERRAPFNVVSEPLLGNDQILDRGGSWRPALLF